MNRIKIVLINDSFANPIFYRRWQILAKEHSDLEIILLTPYKSKVYTSKKNTFGKGVTNYGQVIDDDNFHIKLYAKKFILNFGGWSPDIKGILKSINPDIIYHIGIHFELSLIQVLRIRNKHLPKAKVLAFSMRGPAYSLKQLRKKVHSFSEVLKRRILLYYFYKFGLRFINKNCDAFFCHYPEAVDCFREEGYEGPVYMQTQVGVNPELFHEDPVSRSEIRAKYNLGDSYVFGSATRFTPAKGIDDALEAFPSEGNWKYLVMGAGSSEEIERIKNVIARRHLEGKVILTGYIKLEDMPKYWNAVDCVLHVPRTTYYWQETFSIAIVQAMITKKPVIGSSSGSVPYQLGIPEMIVPEKNIPAISEKIKFAINNQDYMAQIGLKMYERASKCFSIVHLNYLFYQTITEDVMKGEYDEKKKDMTKY